MRGVLVVLLPPLAYQWLRYLFWYRGFLPLRRPRTFTQRLFHKMARDRDPLLRRTSDKLGLRDYVLERLGPGYLPELYAVLRSPHELHEVWLPSRYVVKATHGSGMTRIVLADRAEARDAIRAPARQWPATRYWRRNGEWNYRGIPPRLLVEEFLDGGGGEPPPDWKWMCFGGKAALVQVDCSRFSGHTRNFYDPEGVRLPLRVCYPPGPDLPLPTTFADMRRVAERLARPFDFVRVDLYAVGERIVCGGADPLSGRRQRVVRPARMGRSAGRALARGADGVGGSPTGPEHLGRRGARAAPGGGLARAGWERFAARQHTAGQESPEHPEVALGHHSIGEERSIRARQASGSIRSSAGRSVTSSSTLSPSAPTSGEMISGSDPRRVPNTGVPLTSASRMVLPQGSSHCAGIQSTRAPASSAAFRSPPTLPMYRTQRLRLGRHPPARRSRRRVRFAPSTARR